MRNCGLIGGFHKGEVRCYSISGKMLRVMIDEGLRVALRGSPISRGLDTNIFLLTFENVPFQPWWFSECTTFHKGRRVSQRSSEKYQTKLSRNVRM